jgi:hypothetical protein
MEKKIRIDKKNRTCERCGYTCATPQKLIQHLNRKNPCPLRNLTVSAPPTLQPDQEINSNNKHSEIVDNNARKPNETVKQWGSRLRKRYKKVTYQDYDQPKTLAECKRLYNDLSQIDPNAFSGTPDKSLDKQTEIAKLNLLNDEFQRLSNITEENGEDILFREQNLGPALKRRAVAVHNAKVPRFNPNNGSDIRKMLESQRKPFRNLLEKEFDKRGQFKFSLCSLSKFIVDKKPGDNSHASSAKEVDKKKSTRRDWLRNKQIIIYNRAEIDNYLSDAFEQIIYQVEERGRKSNA